MLADLLRPALCTLIFAWCSPAVSAGSSDPFNTEEMIPPKPSLLLKSTVSDPCETPAANHPLNLPEVVNLALCNNTQTRLAWASSRAQAAQIGVNKASYLPGLALSATGSHNLSGSTASVNQSNVGATLSYLLYDFGSRAANLENARQLLIAANAAQDSTVQSVFLSSVQAYYQTQATQAALDAAIESERAAKESLAAAEARYKIGNATPADKLQAQTAYSQATLHRITANGNLKIAQGTLANILGLDANQDVLLVTANTIAMPVSFESDLNTLIATARQHRPDLQAASAQVKAAQASVDAARAADKPTLSLSVAANQFGSGGINSHNSLIGINLNVPVFSGYALTYRIRVAEAQADVKNGQLEQVHLQVALDVWTAYQNLTTAAQSLRTTADLLGSAEQSERVSLGRYKAGVGSMLDVLNAQSALASARQQRIQSTFNWNISRASLAQTMGNLDIGLLQTLSGSGNQQPGEIPAQK